MENRVVALYNFDPQAIDWPFRRQRPLKLETGQVVDIIFDDGGEWALGQLRGADGTAGPKGYFPKNYTVSQAEYREMMREYDESEGAAEESRDPSEAEDEDQPQMPPPTMLAHAGEQAALQGGDDDGMGVDEPAFPEVRRHPALEAKPPIDTTISPAKSRHLNEMPQVPPIEEEEEEAEVDEMQKALDEAAAEAEMPDQLRRVPGGKLTDSRCSTPATYSISRPYKDFVPRKHLPVEMQDSFLADIGGLDELVKEEFKPRKDAPPPYPADMRIRATTIRIAAGIEPAHMRIALEKARRTGARWTQMFRPGLNDIVNHSFKVACNPAILSNLYLYDYQAREQFQRQHIRDVNGILWFELQRRKTHLFYMRMDFVDVMMVHPTAWGFPDASHVIHGNPGEAFNPFHGWYAQDSVEPDKEMEDVEFNYTLRLRSLPEHTFQALALGKIPEWIQDFTELRGEAQLGSQNNEELDEDDEPVEQPGTPTGGSRWGGAHGPAWGNAGTVDTSAMREAGLEDSEDVYVKLDPDRLAKERTIGPDVLDLKTECHRLKGARAMRLFLRSRGAPDATKQGLITPKQIKDMAAQLGISGDVGYYYYAYFALRYPLAPEWDMIIKNDTRWYLNLKEDRPQLVHPMIQKFREHLEDCQNNEFLWDYRGFMKMKCSECGIPDAIVWCMQCTDYFCSACFLSSHKSKRGRKHWPLPLPGCRYLNRLEVKQIEGHLPLLNVGFSNRRRFLARDNQSDKTGSRNGDKWLFFHRDAFQAALAQCPEKHYYLKRLDPPRLAPDAEGFFYNFAHDVIADDASYIMNKTEEQKALLLLQKCIRGSLTRKRIRDETASVVKIQTYKRMWDCQKFYGKSGSNALILRGWYRKFKARLDKNNLEYRWSKVAAIWRGMQTRKMFREQIAGATKFQAGYRGLVSRRRMEVFRQAAVCVQRYYRGHLYGRRPVKEMHTEATRIQGLFRGVIVRSRRQQMFKAAQAIQARIRGVRGRKRVSTMRKAVIRIQTNWRRWQAQLNIKIRLYEKLEDIYMERKEVLRAKLANTASLFIQRNWRKYRDYQLFVFLRRQKNDADKRISTVLVSLFSAAGSIRRFVHPWWRHLPTETQEVLEQIKASLQRSIALTPVSGKLVNEELGKKSQRCTAKDLHLDIEENGPDLASHMLLSVVHHLLSHIPPEIFGPTVKWACYAIGHTAVEFLDGKQYPHEEIMLGKEVPPRPGDPLVTMWQDMAKIRHHHDRLMMVPNENYHLLFLAGLPGHLRHVYLTAEVLITMRQALDTPSLSTDDHLAFQGVDAAVGAQLMDVLGCEIEHRLPLDLPKMHGTVFALSAQMGKIVQEIADTHVSAPEDGAPKKAAKKEKEEGEKKEKAEKGKDEKKGKKGKDKGAKGKEVELTEEEKEALEFARQQKSLANFNRKALLRIIQQTSYLMRDQDALMSFILNQDAKDQSDKDGKSVVKQNRFVTVTDKLFDQAYRAKHDHCPFVLSVVLFHMILRSLMLRVLYHRAAVSIQTRYRYLKMTGKRARALGPVILIQRSWRGVRCALQLRHWDDAAEMIQHNWKATRRAKRNLKLVKATLLIQRCWRSAIQRVWLRMMHKKAAYIQKFVRSLLVRVTLDKAGRSMMKGFKDEVNALFAKKSVLTESAFLARKAAIAGKSRVAMAKHRDKNLDLKRMNLSHKKSRHVRQLERENRNQLKGTVQPTRLSVFEPMVFAVRRHSAVKPPRYGTKKSHILGQIDNAKRALDKAIPKLSTHRPHVTALRGRAILAARRLARRPKKTEVEDKLVNEKAFSHWQTHALSA